VNTTIDHSVFYRPDALPAAQPTASKHWRHYHSDKHFSEVFFTYKMVAKINWHRYGTKLRHWHRMYNMEICINLPTLEVITRYNFLVEELACFEHWWLETHITTLLKRISNVHSNMALLLRVPTTISFTLSWLAAVWHRSPAANRLLPWQDLDEPIRMQELLVSQCWTHKLCAHYRPAQLSQNSVETNCYSSGSQRPHCCSHLVNNIEFINHKQALNMSTAVESGNA